MSAFPDGIFSSVAGVHDAEALTLTDMNMDIWYVTLFATESSYTQGILLRPSGLL